MMMQAWADHLDKLCAGADTLRAGTGGARLLTT